MARKCYAVMDPSTRGADGLLRQWGCLVRMHRDGFVDELGWPGRSIESMMKDGGTGGAAQFSLPELALARLDEAERGAMTIGSFVWCLNPLMRSVIYLWYVHQLDAVEIGVHVQKARSVVYRTREAGIRLLWAALLLNISSGNSIRA